MRVAIDISNTYHKSYSIVSNYEGFDITETKWQLTLGRKFVTDLLSIVKKFPEATQVILCFDSAGNFRKTLSTEYKAQRSKKAQEFYDLLHEIHGILKSKNINCAKIDGLEADDLLALCHESKGNMFTVLVSNDEDIRQLVDDSTVVFTASSINYKVFCNTVKAVAKNIPDFVSTATVVDPTLIQYEKLFLGCDGDNVKRIFPRGKGPKAVKQVHELVYKGEYDLENALKQFGYEISNNVINEQMKLVFLGSNYMPQNLSEEFYNKINNFTQSLKVETDMKILLQGTRFIQ